MKITVIGSGCSKCEALYNKLEKLKKEGKISAEIEYKKGVKELVERGIVGSPAILIDNKPVFVGMPSDNQIIEAIRKNSK